jgi:methyltransferase (TIGR00027 family)
MRTDHDTWDLTVGVGTTATGVAAARALASRRPNALIDDPFAGPLVAALGIDHFTRLANGDALFDDSGIDWGAVADGIAVRTQFFDEFFMHAMIAGVRQIVILASGLDARAYRLPWPVGTAVFELDQPDVLEFKATELEKLGASSRAVIRPVGIDLRHDWPEALCENGFDADAPTAWIAEGLLEYLTPEGQDHLLQRITALSAPGSRLATDSHPDLTAADMIRARAIARAERERTGLDLVDVADLVYVGARSDVDAYLTVRGWATDTTTGANRADASGIPVATDVAVAGLFAARLTTAVKR